MPRTKSSPVKRREKIGSWGGKRNGAGRRRVLSIWDRKEIAQDYFDRMQSHRKTTSERRPRREAVIRELMAEFDVTHRMVERCVAEFLPDIRRNSALYEYAVEGMNEIQPLPKQKIEKLKPGVYTENRLRLVIDSTGNRKWIFRFIWRYTIRDMVVLGGSELSLAMARERAIKASLTLAAGQNPIDGSWSSAILQTVKSKS
jgi:hypothetical protein